MNFINPMFLWAMGVLPVLGAAMVWLAWKRKQKLQASFGEDRLVARYSQPLAKEVFQCKALWVFLTLASISLALARPVLERGETEFPIGSVDVVAVVDVSRSMASQDYLGKIPGKYWGGGTRLDMARYLITTDIMSTLKANRMGVVSFAGEDFPQAFLTDDMTALGWMLKRTLIIGSAPGEGSSVGKAFKLAFELYDLDSSASHRKVLVFFSDGGNDDGIEVLSSIAKECRQRNIELIVVGLGSLKPSAIPVSQLSPNDQRAMYGDKWYTYQGEVVKTALDENTLRYLANNASGRYVRVEKSDDFHIGQLISSVDVIHKKGQQELFYYPLMASLLFMILAVLTPREGLFRRKR